MQKIQKTFQVNGEEVKITTGNFGFRADVALMAQKGETVVMVFVTVDSQDSTLDYFPLGINYMEKFYAGGIISGSRFIKRERRPSDEAVIKGRIIDRGMRPLFPSDFRRGVSVVINVMAYDGVNDPAILGANAASIAVHMSSIPYDGPASFVRVGMDADSNLVVNPSIEVLKESRLNAVLCSTPDAVTQLEVDAFEVTNEQMAEAFKQAHTVAQDWNKIAEELRSELGNEKIEITEKAVDDSVVNLVKEKYYAEVEEAMLDDENRNAKLDEIYAKANEELIDEDASEEDQIAKIDIALAFKKIEKGMVRDMLLSGKRPSGRALDEIRELEVEDSYLPRVHGAAMFRRGQTQVLAITTLGSTRLAQVNESFEGETEKRYMHHYVGPNYSFGSAGRFSFYPGNREIGHGALAEKAIMPVLPSEEDFPYAIRVVSEVLSQNGSTSMAATCGSCLSLMDAGVPIKRPVAGISVGLITKDESQSDYELLTDVQDVEDFYGDMDFKVCGTSEGITAIQMDTKLKGVKLDILIDALDRGQKAREVILAKYKEVLPEPKAELSQYAPRVESIKIDQEKIGELIGPGGKNIREILQDVDDKADIDIKDDGTVHITAVDGDIMAKVMKRIKDDTMEVEIGEIYEGTVAKIMDFGAFVDITKSQSGLVHKSEIANEFVNDVTKFFKEGDVVQVKVIGKDNMGKIKLSTKGLNKK